MYDSQLEKGTALTSALRALHSMWQYPIQGWTYWSLFDDSLYSELLTRIQDFDSLV